MPACLETTGVTGVHSLFAPFPSTSQLFHIQNYIWHKCIQTPFLLQREKRVSEFCPGKTSVPQVSAIVFPLVGESV